MDLCIECNRVVTGRQQALECDHCHEWQHRTCGTGISQYEYREAVRSREGLDWICSLCLVDINGDSEEEDNTYIAWRICSPSIDSGTRCLCEYTSQSTDCKQSTPYTV